MLFDTAVGVHVIHLPISPVRQVHAWEQATEIVSAALEQGAPKGFLKKLSMWVKPGSYERYWVNFIENRLEQDVGQVCEDIASIVRTPKRTIYTPTLGGPERDATISLV